ncbi:hypothetical protein SRABI118_04213 [Massilia sp. Bi118]|uniref:hypothetical protein n=1 Tax=Massilia sp. Bi118 TaxID=2822346 RepID=UPI001DEDB981|nr:hypothetical protein [Massilia sp. Bi118]CAH0295585.1 hypothetical protein SRABI118_04213 [Massilia sp. Bi118]
MKPGAIPAYPASIRRSPVNLAFSALLFSFLGWVILERWSFGARAGIVPHLVITLACAPVLACSLRRFRAACPRHLRASTRPRGALLGGGLALAMLFAAGALFGFAVGSGLVSMVALSVLLCCLMPWTRLRAHQQHLFLSFLAVAAGALLAANLVNPKMNLLVALPAAWCLWAAAALLCIGLCGGELMKKKGGF